MKCKMGFTRCMRCHLGKTNGHGPAAPPKPAPWRQVAAAVLEHADIELTREQATNIAKQLKEN